MCAFSYNMPLLSQISISFHFFKFELHCSKSAHSVFDWEDLSHLSLLQDKFYISAGTRLMILIHLDSWRAFVKPKHTIALHVKGKFTVLTLLWQSCWKAYNVLQLQFTYQHTFTLHMWEEPSCRQRMNLWCACPLIHRAGPSRLLALGHDLDVHERLPGPGVCAHQQGLSLFSTEDFQDLLRFWSVANSQWILATLNLMKRLLLQTHTHTHTHAQDKGLGVHAATMVIIAFGGGGAIGVLGGGVLGQQLHNK